MNLCSMNHDEICYDGYFVIECPVCNVLKVIEDKEYEIENLESEISILKGKLENE